jgi:nucleoside-diphosphate-sugar epimerase
MLSAGSTILVTGGTGFIGQQLLKKLNEKSNLKIIALTRQKPVVHTSSIIWVNGSLEDLTLDFWLRHDIERIDLILHLGAFIPKFVQDANNLDAACRSNLDGTWRLLETLPNIPKKIVFASTVDVFSLPHDSTILINEQTPSIPATLYGTSKLFCEQMIMNYAAQKKCGFAILRYGHIYGPGEMAYRKFIPEVIRKLLAEEAPVIYGDGATLRDFMYVDDVVEATLRAAEHPLAHIGPINIVRGKSVSLREIHDYLANYAKTNIRAHYLLEKSGGLSLCFDNTQMFNTLGRWELTDLEKGLQLEYDHAKQHLI